MATVYLHIGLPKTGTTAVQYFLSDNREALEKHGICFPDFGYRYANVGVLRNAHFLTAPYYDEQHKKFSDRPGNDYEAGLDKVADLAKKYDKIILTDEGIWRASQHREDFWKTLKYDLWKRELELKLIIYLRRQDLWIQSFWAQKVKTGNSLPFQDYIEFMDETNYPVDYCKRLDELSEIIGKDSIIVRVYEKCQYHGEEHTVQSDFLDIFGLTMKDGFTVKQSVYNTSLEGDFLEIRRRLNSLPDFQKKNQALKANIKQIQNNYSTTSGKYSWFAPGEQARFLDSFAGSNSRLAREYLGREDGTLFYDPLIELPQYPLDTSDLLYETMLIYGNTLHQMEQELLSTTAALKSTRAELKTLQKYSILFRLKRKIWHLLGKDKPSNA